MTTTAPSAFTLPAADTDPVARDTPADTVTRLSDLADRLREAVGPDAVTQDAAPAYRGDRAVTAPDGTAFVLVRPVDVEGVQATLRIAHDTRTPVVPRGAGSGLSGGAVPTAGGIVLSTERLTDIREIDVLDEVAVVEAGVITADLDAALHPHGFFYAPDPASVTISSIGGNIATNAGGLHCAKYGVTRESVLELEVVLADGTLLHTGHRSIKGVTGLDLTQLLIGSEGTLAVVVAATLRIRPLPTARRTLTARFADAPTAAEGLHAISRSPVRPAAAELIDAATLASIDSASGSDLADGGTALLLIELDGYGVEEQASDLRRTLEPTGADVTTLTDDAAAEELWELRRSGRGHPSDEWRLGEDVAVPKSQLPRMFEQLQRIGTEHGVQVAALAHAGDGNLHPAISVPKPPGAEQQEPPEALHRAADDLVRTALRLGGTISGEHGIGVSKRDWLDLELDPASRALHHRLKDAFDPYRLLNPGKAY